MVFSGVALYFINGGSNTNTGTKVSLPTETTSGLSTSRGRTDSGGMSDAGVAGYVAGGGNVDATDYEKYSFPTDVRSVSPQGTVVAKNSSGLSNYGVGGYFVGGGAADKINFPSGTRANIILPVSWSSAIATASDSGTAGYVGSGNSNSAVINKIRFATETVSNLSVGLSVGKGAIAGCANIGVAAYFGGGSQTSGTAIDKFLFPSDTRTTLSATLSSVNGYGYRNASSVSVSGSTGYWVGGSNGWDGNKRPSVDKLSFATDTRTTGGFGYARDNSAEFVNE